MSLNETIIVIHPQIINIGVLAIVNGRRRSAKVLADKGRHDEFYGSLTQLLKEKNTGNTNMQKKLIKMIGAEVCFCLL